MPRRLSTFGLVAWCGVVLVPKFNVTTNSGSVYYIDTDEGTWAAPGYYGGTIMEFKTGVRPYNTRTLQDEMADFQDATQPEVGKAMFLRGRPIFDNWRLSTDVVNVEVL